MFSKGDTWKYGNMDNWYDTRFGHYSHYRYNLWKKCCKCKREYQMTEAEWWDIYYQTGQTYGFWNICQECARVRKSDYGMSANDRNMIG